jgi:hypothetical protein
MTKKKKKNMIDIMFGGSIQGSTVLTYDLPEQGYGWEDSFRDTLCGLESLPNALILNCGSMKWIRTLHLTSTFFFNKHLTFFRSIRTQKLFHSSTFLLVS